MSNDEIKQLAMQLARTYLFNQFVKKELATKTGTETSDYYLPDALIKGCLEIIMAIDQSGAYSYNQVRQAIITCTISSRNAITPADLIAELDRDYHRHAVEFLSLVRHQFSVYSPGSFTWLCEDARAVRAFKILYGSQMVYADRPDTQAEDDKFIEQYRRLAAERCTGHLIPGRYPDARVIALGNTRCCAEIALAEIKSGHLQWNQLLPGLQHAVGTIKAIGNNPAKAIEVRS